MPTIDDFFRQSPNFVRHPILLRWENDLKQGMSAKMELQRVPGTIGLASVQMYIEFSNGAVVRSAELLTWNDELNQGLVALGVRAKDQSQEGQRFALALRGALKLAEHEFGDGYLNAVLLELIRDSALDQYDEIRHVISYAYSTTPNHGTVYERCRDFIAFAISARAHELREQLRYNDEDSRLILVKAIALYIDDRFSVSSRRYMGLL